MYLHLGKDHVVPFQDVVCIFNLETVTVSKRTKALLKRMQDENRIIELYEDLPRSAVLCENILGEVLYLSSITPKILQKRAEISYAV